MTRNSENEGDCDQKQSPDSNNTVRSIRLNKKGKIESKHLVEKRIQQFTESQKNVFDTVMSSVHAKVPQSVFIDARGGTGKTFVLNAVLAAVRSIDGGSVALAVGATGIAANLLMFGRTLHSRF